MKTVKILCGISGSGKSTLCCELLAELTNRFGAIVCSADQYFTESGNYNFNPSKLQDAHAACLRKYTNYVHNGSVGLVIVDNTNTTVAEIAPYAALALANGYELEIIILQPKSIEKCILRNIHDVPEKVIRQQAARLQRLSLPPWWKVQYKEVD